MDLLAEFLKHFCIDGHQPPRRLFFEASRAFSRLPYENITKIIRCAESGAGEKARRYPGEVIADHIRWGTGGTCFSLTSAFCQLTSLMGFKVEYLMADRGYGRGTHSALRVQIDGEPYLVDHGFLISEPIHMTTAGSQEIISGGERLTLSPGETGVSLFTTRGGKSVHRLTYKTTPVEADVFYKTWDASFHWDMMRYPLLARVEPLGKIYMRGLMFQKSDIDSVSRVTIAEEELPAKIADEFGIHPTVVARALNILFRTGRL